MCFHTNLNDKAENEDGLDISGIGSQGCVATVETNHFCPSHVDYGGHKKNPQILQLAT